jgi:hypothetical protein
LKKAEEQENREWYIRLAKDHFAYIAIYRDAIDSLQQLTKELWKIVMNDKSSQSDKTAAIKEIHNIEKTKVLLLRDLPFITRLSKYYDLTLYDNDLPKLQYLLKILYGSTDPSLILFTSSFIVMPLNSFCKKFLKTFNLLRYWFAVDLFIADILEWKSLT